MSKVYAIGYLKAEPLNRLPVVTDVVQWINSLNETFYATVVKIENDEAEIRNFYETTNPYYCFTSDKLDRLVVLDLYLTDEKGNKIGSVSKNIIEGFLKNEIHLNENVWYEIKNGTPRIHRKNLICK